MPKKKKVNRESPEYDIGYEEGFKQGMFEGESNQAIISSRACDKFLAELREKIKKGIKI